MKKSIQGLYLTTLTALGVLSVSLRTAALLTGFDFASGYFNDKLLSNISVTVVITAAVLFATFLIYKKSYNPLVEIGSHKDYVSSGCVGVALIIAAFDIALATASQATGGKVDAAGIVNTLAAALAALSALYFATSVFLNKSSPLTCAAFSMALMLYLVFYALLLYFDNETPINAPVKLCDQMAYVSLAVFFVYETRISLKRPMWRMYVISGLIASLLSAYAAIPSLILYFVNGEVVSHTLSETVLTLSLFAYVLIRTISALTAEEDKENPIVEFVKKLHGERVKEIEEERASRARYNNNEEKVVEQDDNYEIELPIPTAKHDTERSDTQ